MYVCPLLLLSYSWIKYDNKRRNMVRYKDEESINTFSTIKKYILTVLEVIHKSLVTIGIKNIFLLPSHNSKD